MTPLESMDTPALILDRHCLENNIQRMNARANALGVSLRPHLKTAKSVDVARLVFDGDIGPVTVSTIREVAYFVDHGFTDIFLAVGTAPDKLTRLGALMTEATRVKIAVDGRDIAKALASSEQVFHPNISALIEVDCGDNRGGVAPESDELLDIAEILKTSSLPVAGVFTHGGQSYGCPSIDAIRRVARDEHRAITGAAARLRVAGYACPMVSLGSTPTATFVENLDGVTEMRPGVYMFQDLQQYGLGVCSLDDLALSVLATVIGYHAERNVALIDAGGLALSKDRGAAVNDPDPGFGLVCTLDGKIIENLHVIGVSQEHGKISTMDGSTLPAHCLQPGSKIRILPNHACMTAAAYDHYTVTDCGGGVTQWGRVNGW